MSQRFINKPINTLNNYLNNFDDFYLPLGSEINVYKFRKCSGTIYLTKFGEKDLEVDISSLFYNQVFEVYTGKEPVTVVWENSTKLKVTADDKIIKRYQVGEYETCYLAEPQTITNENSEINLYGKEYVMSILKNTITLQSNSWLPSENDIRDFFYIILDKKSKCVRWLEIISTTPIYNPETNKLQYVSIDFETINNKYTKTGKSILDFVQLGAIGEGYAFPKEEMVDNKIQVSLFEDTKQDLPAHSLQFDFISGSALSSVLTYGRKKSTLLSDGSYEVNKPQMLYAFKSLAPVRSHFFYNQPNLNYYTGEFRPDKKAIWKSYKENVKSNNNIGEYNILNSKEVLTGFSFDSITEIRNTNKDFSLSVLENKKQIKFSPSFSPETTPLIKNAPITDKMVNYTDFLNDNAFVNWYKESFNYDYNETVKYKLTDTLGILGGLVNTLVGGLDIGWTTNIASVTNPPLYLLIPCISFEDGISALNENAPLPVDVFFDDKSKTVLPTSTNVLTSIRFSLTDQVQDISQKRTNTVEGKGLNGVWNLKYLGQTKFEDGTLINDDGSPFEINLQTTYAFQPSNLEQEFIIDRITHKTVGSCDYRITGYDNAGDSIYSAIMETNAKARGDIRLWTNDINFNYYGKFNTEGQVKWPDVAKPKKPINEYIAYPLKETINYYLNTELRLNDLTKEPLTSKFMWDNPLKLWRQDYWFNIGFVAQANAWCYATVGGQMITENSKMRDVSNGRDISQVRIECDISNINIDDYKELQGSILGKPITFSLLTPTIQTIEVPMNYKNNKPCWIKLSWQIGWGWWDASGMKGLTSDLPPFMSDTSFGVEVKTKAQFSLNFEISQDKRKLFLIMSSFRLKGTEVSFYKNKHSKDSKVQITSWGIINIKSEKQETGIVLPSGVVEGFALIPKI